MTLHIGLVLLAVLCTAVLRAQVVRPSTGLLFGVRLDVKASALLADVEQLYGKQVREEWLASTDPMLGRSVVADDGTPVIRINPSSGRAQDVIVHELYHFLLRDRGYPVVQWLFPPLMDTDANRTAFDQLRIQLYDPILHHVFYPEARARIGIDPGETFQKLTQGPLNDGSFLSTLAGMDAGAISLHYFKLRLELSDAALFRRFVALLEREGKREEAKLGDRLAEIVLQGKTASPEGAVNALVNCLNVFYQDRFRFEPRPWTSRRLGSHTQRIAPVELKPLGRGAA